MRDRPNDTHRRSASRKTGRRLRPDEDVHHLDGDKTNNAPSNLAVMKHGDHSRVTASTPRSLRALRKSLTMHQRREKLY